MDKPLTDITIRKLKPGETRKDIGEYSGLRVSKSKTGVVRFWYRYRSPITKQLKEMTIGYYADIGLAEARVKLLHLKVKRKTGVCIATEAKNEKERQVQDSENSKLVNVLARISVRSVIDHYLTNYIEDKYEAGGKLIRKGARQPKGQWEVRNLLLGSDQRRADAKANKPMLGDLLGDIPMQTLTHRNVAEAIQAIYDRGSAVSAGNVLREFTNAIDFSIGAILPDDFVNPCYQAKSAFKRRKVNLSSKPRTRVLSDAELSLLLEWLPESRFSKSQQHALQLTLMTGCRSGEVVSAKWSDISIENEVWHLRDTKTSVERYVQLARQALELLVRVRDQKLSDTFIFPRQDGTTHIEQKRFTESAWHMRRQGSFLDIDPWTPHDLRRTVRTGLARLQCPLEVGEAVLGHSKKGIEGTYNLHRYDLEAKVWLQKWNDHMESLYE
jgi:integrase